MLYRGRSDVVGDVRDWHGAPISGDSLPLMQSRIGPEEPVQARYACRWCRSVTLSSLPAVAPPSSADMQAEVRRGARSCAGSRWLGRANRMIRVLRKYGAVSLGCRAGMHLRHYRRGERPAGDMRLVRDGSCWLGRASGVPWCEMNPAG